MAGSNDVTGGTRLTFSPDGGTLAVFEATGRLRLFDVARGRFFKTCTGHHGPGFAVFSPDGQRVAGVSGDAPVIVYRVPPG